MIYALYSLAIIVFVTLDQFSKYLITKNIPDGSQSIELIKGFFSISYVKNYGAGFSILQNQKSFLIIVSVVAIIVVSYLLIKAKSSEKLNIICYLLIIGGSIGNLIDRFTLGYVIDFLDFNIFGYDFPVFNVADCCITVGCFLLIISIILESKHAKN